MKGIIFDAKRGTIWFSVYVQWWWRVRGMDLFSKQLFFVGKDFNFPSRSKNSECLTSRVSVSSNESFPLTKTKVEKTIPQRMVLLSALAQWLKSLENFTIYFRHFCRGNGSKRCRSIDVAYRFSYIHSYSLVYFIFIFRHI